jgi:hypothetical protein
LKLTRSSSTKTKNRNGRFALAREGPRETRAGYQSDAWRTHLDAMGKTGAAIFRDILCTIRKKRGTAVFVTGVTLVAESRAAP